MGESWKCTLRVRCDDRDCTRVTPRIKGLNKSHCRTKAGLMGWRFWDSQWLCPDHGVLNTKDSG